MIRFGLGIKKKARYLAKEFQYWVQNNLRRPHLFNLRNEERIGVVYHVPSDMCVTDRIMLYALVRGLKPHRALEIGVRWGGSARIITNAMQENGIGKLVGIEPITEQFRAKSQTLHDRYELVRGYSPDAIVEAVKKLDGPLDFVFIDALHIHDAALADCRGVIPHLAQGGHLLLHDTYHVGICEAVNKILREEGNFVDCGFLTRNPRVGKPVSYQGLRLIRLGPVDGYDLIKKAYREAGQGEPELGSHLWNYDEYFNRIGKAKYRLSDK
jgi:predicted O-methyltransferase YrrM